MAITTRSEYGLRALVVLAEQLPGELTSAKELARREQIPLKYLEQILSELKKTGFVVSQAGARGGYRLARSAREVVVGDVVRVLDGSQAPMGCTNPSAERAHAEGNLQVLWQRLHLAINGVLDGTTLDQLAFRPRMHEPATSPVDEGDEREPQPEVGVYQI